ncbi:hypothetical protein AB205_0213800, partial [Aquarana catesbeiana]
DFRDAGRRSSHFPSPTRVLCTCETIPVKGSSNSRWCPRMMTPTQLKCWQPGRGSKTSAPHLRQFCRPRVRKWRSLPSIRTQGENAISTSQLQLDLVSVDGASVSTCIPQGCWAVGPDAQQHDGLSPATLSSLLQLKGLQGEGPVCTSSQQQVCSMREAEVGWVSNALFGTICFGYCVGTGIRGL